ncbi:DUF998 domain-containing protein [Rhodococcus sp. W8901]|uniref:DUF998 domain-containing protein n=1 Tax=Rhodococcus sp. W8901 TaxID=2742603 RepID=UPI0015830970|nr:DUF998 domain-containing protein [Rhodococcus sp. W8901]QKT13000.1 DUF998 domain-containing protein [Rhodococcus sp. W8901]
MTAIDHAAPAAHPTAGQSRRLLMCGVVAGPLYLTVTAAQLLTRDGFDSARHPLSLLSLGTFGWIQIANFVVAGVLFFAGALGMRRVMVGGVGRTWGPRLIGFFALTLVWAGVFVPDPSDGFPTNSSVEAAPTMHGILHSVAPVLAFLVLIAACVVFARRFFRQGHRGWAVYSAGVALALLAPDVLIGRTGFTVALAAAAVVGWTWVSAIALHLARSAGHHRGRA